MSDLGIFIFGIVIFAAYMIGLLSMINKQHKIQEKQWPKGKLKNMVEEEPGKADELRA